MREPNGAWGYWAVPVLGRPGVPGSGSGRAGDDVAGALGVELGAMELVGVGGAGLVGPSVGPPVGVGADGVILGEGTPVGLGIGRAVGERLGDSEALGGGRRLDAG